MSVKLDFMPVLQEWPMLLEGVAWTIGLTTVASIFGLAIGVLFAWARSHGSHWLQFLVGTYVEFIRNTPFIVQLFFIYFGLPAMGLRLSPEVAAVLAMIINLSAYATEIVRAGIVSTPKGQIEAAQSLALNRWQLFLHVILPPALIKVWPAMTSQMIIVMLGSAVCGQISVPELSFSSNMIHSRNFRAFEASIIATLIYLSLAICLRKVINLAGQKWFFGR